MRDGWADGDDPVERLPVAPWAQARRAQLSRAVRRRADRRPGRRAQAAGQRHRLPVPRRHRARLPDRQPDRRTPCSVIDDGEATLFFRPRHAKSDDAFWRDGRYGEAWSGRRRSLTEAEELFGLPCRHIYDLPDVLASGGDGAACTAASTPTSTPCWPRTADAERRRRARGLHVGDAAGQGRLGGRAAAGRDRLHDPRASRTPCASGTTCCGTASAGSRARSGGGPAPTGNDVGYESHRAPAARTRRRCTGSRTTAR